MKKLPEQKTLDELLELAKDAFRHAKEMNDLAIKIEEKYKIPLDQVKEIAESETRLNK